MLVFGVCVYTSNKKGYRPMCEAHRGTYYLVLEHSFQGFYNYLSEEMQYRVYSFSMLFVISHITTVTEFISKWLKIVDYKSKYIIFLFSSKRTLPSVD